MPKINTSESLEKAENSLRDFISYILQKEKGSNWIQKSGVTDDRINKWKKSLEVEKKKFNNSIIESRLIYYANFYDLRTILKANWEGEFSTAFGKWKKMEIFLKELEKYRNPEAHSRDLLIHQKHLVFGISEEIRNKIIRYRSMKEEKTSEDFYPRFERVSDNLGNIWSPASSNRNINTKNKLHVGDKIKFVLSATDPFGEDFKYGIKTIGGSKNRTKWFSENEYELIIEDEDVKERSIVEIVVKSLREYHAHIGYDDRVRFIYEVLPPL